MTSHADTCTHAPTRQLRYETRDGATHLPWSVDGGFEHSAVLALLCDLWLVNAEKLMAELDSEQNKRTKGDWNRLPFCWCLPSALELICRVSRALPDDAD